MKVLSLFILAVLLPIAASAQVIDATNSKIEFQTRLMGAPTTGRLALESSTVSFNPKNPAMAKMKLVFDMRSASLGIAEIDSELRGGTWLDVKQHSVATFMSSKVTAAGSSKYDVVGALNLKGRTQEVKVGVTVAQQGQQALVSGMLELQRSQWGLGSKDWDDPGLVGPIINVKFGVMLKNVAEER